jgi:hypothetical protein
MTDAREVAARLTKAQRDYILTDGREGSPRGLVRRGLLRYRWGTNPSFGYVSSEKARAVRAELERQEQPK